MVFQFDGNCTKESTTTTTTLDDTSANTNETKILEKANNASYYDRLNSWLGQILQRNFPEVYFMLLKLIISTL